MVLISTGSTSFMLSNKVVDAKLGRKAICSKSN